MHIEELIYDPKKRCDVAHKLPFAGFNPGTYKTKEAAAKGFYEALKQFAVSYGQSESEVALFDPDRSEKAGTGRCWRVIWEGGPFEWAIAMSWQVRGPWGYTEPYYSFDLCFVD